MEIKDIKGKEQQTCLVIMTGLLLFWYFTKNERLVFAAILIGFIGAFLPGVAKWINWAWYKIAEIMGWVMSRILLTAIFYLFLFPIAMLARMFGKSNVQFFKKEDTYWVERRHQYEKKDLENMW